MTMDDRTPKTTPAPRKLGDASGADDPARARLNRLGFSDPEARTYLALIEAQPATAYELAKISGLPRANSYNAVSSLVAKGAIQPISSQPVRYAPASPAHYFPQLAAAVTSDAEAVMVDLATRTAARPSEYVERSEGAEAVLDKVATVIESARSTVHLKAVDTVAAPFFDALRAAAGRGVAIYVVASGEQWGGLETLPGVTVMPHEGTGSAPSAAHEVLLTVTADAETAVVAAFDAPPCAYHAANPMLVYVIQTMILHEIYLARIIGAMGAGALAAAGVDPASLRAVYRPERHGAKITEPGANR